MADEDPREGPPSLNSSRPPPAALIGTIFPSRNSMEETLNGFAATLRYSIYAIVVASSKKKRRGLQQVYYKCDRGGAYRTFITSATDLIMLM